MNYMGNSHWWNERFKYRKLNIMHHEKCLENDIKYFPSKGSVLDLACGDGRNSIYMASLGYTVFSADFSSVALKRLNSFAEDRKLTINTYLMDLSDAESFSLLDSYDAIIINHYRLNPMLYNLLLNHLNDNGILWVNGFSEQPADNPNITKNDVLRCSDFNSLTNYNLIDSKQYNLNERKFIRYIWKKSVL